MVRERVLDLTFLIGVLFKGVDGLVELVGGAVLLFVTPAQLRGAAGEVTAGELTEDPHDILANLLIHAVAHLGSGGAAFLAAYLLLHGVVKIAIVIALLVGSRRIYPWAMTALGAFLVFQLYELVTAPSVGVVLLTVFDAVIIWLTWREWRRNRELRDTWRGTLDWVFRRKVPA
jgi:uncharacterized membrane protein